MKCFKNPSRAILGFASFGIASQKKSLQLDKLAALEDQPGVLPIIFSWDYIPEFPDFLTVKDWSFEYPFDKDREEVDPSFRNSFRIHPKAAGLPFHTGLTCSRYNRFATSALDYASELCELLADDDSHNSVNLIQSSTLASIGTRELAKPPGERFVTFAINLFPQADEERMALIAVGILCVVIFDDTWEETAGDELKKVQDDFVARMRAQKTSADTEDTPLQVRFDEIVYRLNECDRRTNGDAGKDFINAMLEWVMHSQPERKFTTPREYLDYRWMDAANWWIIATCKFSIGAKVSLQDPVVAKIVRLAGDHISIVNDLGSFDKELHAYQSGRTTVLINLVQIMRDSLGLSIPDAKTAAFTLQLLNEREILRELERLKEEDDLTVEHWRFVDTIMAAIAGNVVYTMTTSRYGGEQAKIVAKT